METQRIRALNVEIGIFKKQIDKLHGMLSQENYQYNVLESQFETLMIRNKEWSVKNADAEKKLNDAIGAADNIIKMAEENAKSIKSNAYALYVKAQGKYKELEERLDSTEKSVIRKHLKELETVTA